MQLYQPSVSQNIQGLIFTRLVFGGQRDTNISGRILDQVEEWPFLLPFGAPLRHEDVPNELSYALVIGFPLPCGLSNFLLAAR